MKNFTYSPLASLQGKNSFLYLLPFRQPAQANDRVYLPMNSDLDQTRIVGIETHVHYGFGTDFDFPPTINIDGVTYNVITPFEQNGILLTLVNKKRQQVLDRYPFKALVNQFAGTGSTEKTRTFRKYDLSILSGESYVTFTVNSVIASPFVAPITFYYE